MNEINEPIDSIIFQLDWKIPLKPMKKCQTTTNEPYLPTPVDTLGRKSCRNIFYGKCFTVSPNILQLNLQTRDIFL